jgi:O-antigen ligase
LSLPYELHWRNWRLPDEWSFVDRERTWDAALPLPARPWRETSHRLAFLAIAAVGIALTAVLPPTLILLVPLAPVVVAFFLRWPLAALFALTFSIPFQSLRAVTIAGLQLTTTEVLLGVVALAWGLKAVIRGRFEPIEDLPWGRALFIFGAAMLVSVSQASAMRLSAKELLKWAEMLFAYMMVLRLVRSPREVPRLFILLLAAGVAEALTGLAQGVLHGGGAFHAAGVLRAAGTFDQPNPFAGFLNMSLPFSFAILLLGLPRFDKVARWTALLVGVAVLISLSRGAWLATLAATITMVWMTRPSWRPQIILGLWAVGLLVVFSAAGVLPAAIGDQIAGLFGLSNVDVVNPTPANWSAAERLAHWEAGLGMFFAHPLLGVGIGNYDSAYPAFQVAPVWIYPLGHAHNYYINIAAEAGIVGLAAYLFFLASTFWLCLRLWRSATTPWGRVIGLGAVGVIVAAAVQSFFDNVFVHGMEVQIALVMALVALMERYGPRVDAAAAGEPEGAAAIQHAATEQAARRALARGEVG